MSLREWMDANQTTATLIMAGLLVVALGTLAMRTQSPGSARAGQMYFWDMERDEAFTARDPVAPIEAPSGGEGVRAHLFTCGECTPDEWFGYLEKYTDEAAEVLRDVQSDAWDDLRFVASNHLLRSLDNGQWVLHGSHAGVVIRRNTRQGCGPGAGPRQCRP